MLLAGARCPGPTGVFFDFECEAFLVIQPAYGTGRIQRRRSAVFAESIRITAYARINALLTVVLLVYARAGPVDRSLRPEKVRADHRQHHARAGPYGYEPNGVRWSGDSRQRFIFNGSRRAIPLIDRWIHMWRIAMVPDCASSRTMR